MNTRAIVCFFVLAFSLPAAANCAENERGELGLKEAIQIAVENNYNILSAQESIEGAKYTQRSALSEFFPKLSVEGNHTWLSEVQGFTQDPTPAIPISINPDNPVDIPDPNQPIGYYPGAPGFSLSMGEKKTWTIQGSVTQPIFTGGTIFNNYKLSKVGVKSAQTAEARSRQDLSLSVVNDYFNVLNAAELKKVADQAVRLLENQRDVSKEFFDVGMIPKNDLLKTEVQLAEQVREQIRAANSIELAKAKFNLTLQRPINTPVRLINLLEYKPVPFNLDEGIQTALGYRLEIKELALKIEASEYKVRLARSTYFPQIQLKYNMFRTEGSSLEGSDKGWNVVAGGSWTFFEWGKKRADVAAARSDVKKDELALKLLKDQIALEVKDAYLALDVEERNIAVALKAIEQGEENYRMNQERYKEQVGTITDLLDAQTLLTRAQTDYYNSLRAYNVAKASLRRAMGLTVYDPDAETMSPNEQWQGKITQGDPNVGVYDPT